MHLGILVVYHLKSDDDLPLLRLHLERIQRHTSTPYTVFAVANRVTETARAVIAEQPNLLLCNVERTAARDSREHGYYLDALVPLALDAGVSHIVTLDVDSFPVADDWIEVLLATMLSETGFCGVLREENGDVALPHPSCTMGTRAFFERFTPSFSPDSENTPEFRRFLRTTQQPADTGIRIGAALWNAGLPWGHLLRTNDVDAHYLMAGIYGDVVFHLGGVGRGKLFRQDVRHSRLHRLTNPLERVPLPTQWLSSIQRRALRRVRSGTESRQAAYNRDVYALLRDWLYTDPDSLFAYLRGQVAPRASTWAMQLSSMRPRPGRAMP